MTENRNDTKDQFKNLLTNCSKQVIKQKRREQAEQREMLKGAMGSAEKSFGLLKTSSIYVIYLIITYFFAQVTINAE